MAQYTAIETYEETRRTTAMIQTRIRALRCSSLGVLVLGSGASSGPLPTIVIHPLNLAWYTGHEICGEARGDEGTGTTDERAGGANLAMGGRMTCGRVEVDLVEPGQEVALRTRGAAQCSASNGQGLGRGVDGQEDEGDVTGVSVREIGEISGVEGSEEIGLVVVEDIAQTRRDERAAGRRS